MERATQGLVMAVIIAGILLVILSVFTLLFFLVIVRKRRILQRNKDAFSLNYEKALLHAKLEIHELTLNNMSREIHDNIGQVLSFIKLSLSMAAKFADEQERKKITESIRLIGEVIYDLRDLSKSLSLERIKKEGLWQVVPFEAARLNRKNGIRTAVSITGEPFSLCGQKELLLFRIFQEIIQYYIKHAASAFLLINLNYCNNFFTLTVRDTGKRLVLQDPDKLIGLGLDSIRQRAALIGAVVTQENGGGAGSCTMVSLDRSAEPM